MESKSVAAYILLFFGIFFLGLWFAECWMFPPPAAPCYLFTLGSDGTQSMTTVECPVPILSLVGSAIICGVIASILFLIPERDN